MHTFLVVEDQYRDDICQVETQDASGDMADDIAHIRFEGKQATAYAQEYANWKNSQLKLKNESVPEKPRNMKLAS